MAERTLRVCALYPELMNIYADRGNLLLLERRCAWRGLGFTGRGATSATASTPTRTTSSTSAAARTATSGSARATSSRTSATRCTRPRTAARWCSACAAATSCSATATCSATRSCPGVGLVDLAPSARTGPRLIGNVAIEVELPGLDGPRVLAGFENHGGRTHLGAGARPLGRVLRGHGNTGAPAWRACARGNVIGTYLHGPLLPKNAWFADWLVATALGLDAPLAALDDRLEDAAHAGARQAAGI